MMPSIKTNLLFIPILKKIKIIINNTLKNVNIFKTHKKNVC
jgi:hypothetical protein